MAVFRDFYMHIITFETIWSDGSEQLWETVGPLMDREGKAVAA